MAQTQVHPTQTRPEETRREEADDLAERDTETAGKGADRVTVDDATNWLEEIDEALGEEINFAAEFWASYQCKGGQ